MREIQLKMQLKLGQINAIALANHASLVSVVSGALGDGKSTGSGPPRQSSDRVDIGAGHADVDTAVAAINGLLRF